MCDRRAHSTKQIHGVGDDVPRILDAISAQVIEELVRLTLEMLTLPGDLCAGLIPTRDVDAILAD
ncbi:hypothetical protein NS228_19390 [Methylobacterium indicum]|nr:hypothetical protein NS229_22625 [Methylobacterium indicum]KTS37246.1 hypothetical protein NS228_19390 [Methylobacterium indicum]KTS47739.1 hypothetical protein NS230_20755 [Methylobacterium indicum]